MPTVPLQHVLAAADAAVEADKRGLLRSAFWLWVALALTSVIAVALIWVMVGWARSNRRVFRRRRIKDAWAEAGRRVEPLSHDDMQPDSDDPDDRANGTAP